MCKRFGSRGLGCALLALSAAAPAFGQLQSGTFSNTDFDNVSRYFHAASTLPDGVVMVSGGLGLQIFPPSLLSLNAITFYNAQTNTFSSSYTPLAGGTPVSPTLATARSSHTQTPLPDGRVLITGGNVGASGTSAGTPTNAVEIFDPFTGQVTVGPAMNIVRAAHTATLLRDGRVLVAGAGSWQIFNPVTNLWTASAALQRTRTAHAAVLLPNFAGVRGDDRVLLVGGGGNGANTLELLDPATRTSVLAGETLSVGLDDLAATRLPSELVFIVGGQDTSTGNTVSDTYLYDPVLDDLVPGPATPARSAGLADHQLVRFGPYVFVFGGEQQLNGVDTILDYAAVFDGVTQSWLESGTMLNVRDDFAVAPLSSSSVLLIDGGVPLFGQEAPSVACERFTVTLSDAIKRGDQDNDADVDIDDLDLAAACLNGPLGGRLVFNCRAADLDADGDADLSDLAALQPLVDSATL